MTIYSIAGNIDGNYIIQFPKYETIGRHNFDVRGGLAAPACAIYPSRFISCV